MLTATPERLGAALEQLPSEDRALLELSLRREVADGALAELLRIDQVELRRRRAGAVDRLAAELTGGTEGDEASAPARAEPVRLAPLPASRGAAGEARIEGSGRGAVLSIGVQNLPGRGPYQAWLYDSVSRAVPVLAFRDRNAGVSGTLDVDPSRYRFLDISAEPADRNPNHSGASLLRAPIDRLLGG